MDGGTGERGVHVGCMQVGRGHHTIPPRSAGTYVRALLDPIDRFIFDHKLRVIIVVKDMQPCMQIRPKVN